jgi:stage V sporulation protein S
MTDTPETLKVSSKSRPKSVAGALSTVVERDHRVALQAIGAGAVNQAVKAIAIARSFLAPKGLDLVTSIGFATMTIDGHEKSAIRFEVTSCRAQGASEAEAGAGGA